MVRGMGALKGARIEPLTVRFFNWKTFTKEE